MKWRLTWEGVPVRCSRHFNGAYHSDFYQSTVGYVKEKDKDARILTVSTVTQDKLDRLDKEHIGRADYIIVVNSNMTSTH